MCKTVVENQRTIVYVILFMTLQFRANQIGTNKGKGVSRYTV